MNKLTFYIGLPGSSVHKKAEDYAGEHNLPLVYLLDGESIDTIKMILEKGDSVVVVGKLYSLSSRVNFLNRWKDYNCVKECVLVADTYGTCLKNLYYKKELDHAYAEFFLPWTYEGWNSVKVIKSEEEIYSNNYMLFNDDYSLVHSKIIIRDGEQEAEVNTADLSMTYYQVSIQQKLNYLISKSLLFNYIGYVNKRRYELEQINSAYDSLFCSQIDEMMVQELRIIDDEDVEKDLYIALLIQNQSLFNTYCDRDELHSIKQVFGDRMCRDLYERQQLLNLVHDHVIKEVQEA